MKKKFKIIDASTGEKIKLGLCTFLMLFLSGCNFQSPDYYKIMTDCAQRKGYYFKVTIPTWLGPRLVAGCAEDFSELEVTVVRSVLGEE